MADYQFLTRWRFDASLERVWDEIYHTSRWPSWWKAVIAVEEVVPGDDLGLGAIKRFTWRGALPYHITFEMKATRIETHRVLEGEASGELDGVGRWEFFEEEGGTLAQYDWRVRATKPWMKWLSPIARPVFSWNHDVVMRWGEEGLKALLYEKDLTAG